MASGLYALEKETKHKQAWQPF